jgi:hypothetical protein
MTKDELIEKLKAIDTDDPSVAHPDADDLLLEFINDKNVSEAYNKIPKWYE